MLDLALATEDELSEKVGLKLLANSGYEVNPALLLRKNGAGYLRSHMQNWRRLSQTRPVVLFTDLDRVLCPATLLRDWCGNEPLPKGLLVRVAVREVEAWLLADHEAVRELIGPKGKLPADPEALQDPKAYLLGLAQQYAKREIRDELVRVSGNRLSQGIGYNARLTDLVENYWSPERAQLRSVSLRRSRQRLSEFIARLVAKT